MTDKAISDLDPVGLLTGNEFIGLSKEGQSLRASAAQIAALASFQKEGANWAVPFRGALVRRTTQSGVLSFPIFVPFQEAVYDTDDFWSLSAPTRFTIPAGITKIRILAGVQMEAAAQTGSFYCNITKNGGTHFSTAMNIRQGTNGYTNNPLLAFTPVLEVETGDYFEVRINRSGIANSDQVESDPTTFFSIEVVEAVGATARPYDLNSFFAGAIPATTKISQFVMTRQGTLRTDAAGSQFYLDVAPSDVVVFDLQNNGVSSGTITFAATENFGVASITETPLLPGDRISLVSPADTFGAEGLAIGLMLEI